MELELDVLLALEFALHDVYKIFPNLERVINSVDYLMLRLAQVQEGLSILPQYDPLHYSIQNFGRSELVCHRAEQNDNWKIVVPNQLLTHIVSWYHSLLNHTGQCNLEKTIKTRKTFSKHKFLNMTFLKEGCYMWLPVTLRPATKYVS